MDYHQNLILKYDFYLNYKEFYVKKWPKFAYEKGLGSQLIGTNFERDGHARFSLSFDWWAQTQSKEPKALKVKSFPKIACEMWHSCVGL